LRAEALGFPFTVWARLMRAVILEKDTELLKPVPSGGAMELRKAISDYLYRTRGFYVEPRRIIVGSGTEYLYNLLIQLLGREGQVYGIENPGYEKLAKIYELNGAEYRYIGLDEQGMSIDELEKSGVTVAHISPAHHFPTGIVMPISRRREIMERASKYGDSFIIEDDYDSEFRWVGKPVPTMFAMDNSGNVIYMNTFSQTIAPSVRISYMCLPERLYERWEGKMGFYSCSVPAFEQYTLAKFISEGYFERHINRSKKRFRRVRELVLRLMESFGEVTEIHEENAGLHFTVSLSSDADRITEICSKCGIKITPLSEYYTPKAACENDRYVVNYSSADEDKLTKIIG
jgi:GntR family transcriptional regulator/MocR family aminotransferase